MFKKFIILLVAAFILAFCTSCDNDPENKFPVITQEYVDFLGGKVYSVEKSTLTFHSNGEASYDYSNFHYDYLVEVTNINEENIEMLLHYNMKDSLNYNTIEIIDYEPKPATYNFADNTIFYFNRAFYEDASDGVTNYCAVSGCEYYVIPSSETDCCFMHTAFCENCDNYVNPGIKFCSGCKACVKCGEGVFVDFGDLCYKCRPKTNTNTKTKEKCYRCSGTGKVTLHYGNRWNKEEGYGYGDKCGNCNGSGYQN